jgi:hypothetical protein
VFNAVLATWNILLPNSGQFICLFVGWRGSQPAEFLQAVGAG